MQRTTRLRSDIQPGLGDDRDVAQVADALPDDQRQAIEAINGTR
jgi:hypothetical protein